MKSFLLKLATITSSLLLVGGLIAYRCGVIQTILAAGDDSQARPIETPTVVQSPASADQAPALMSGSKSFTFMGGLPEPSQPPPANADTPPIILPGSKSPAIFPLFNPPPAPEPPPPAPKAEPKDTPAKVVPSQPAAPRQSN